MPWGIQLSKRWNVSLDSNPYIYKCSVLTPGGETKQITLQLTSSEEVQSYCQRKGLFLLKYRKVKLTKRARQFNLSNKQIIDITDSLYMLIKSGMSVKESVSIALGNYRRGPEKRFLEKVESDLNQGKSFSFSLKDSGAGFSPLYISMVKIGENVGTLNKVYGKLSEYLHSEKEIREKVLGALIYPSLVLTMVVAGAAALAFFLLPRISDMFQSLAINDPGSVVIVIGNINLFLVLLITVIALLVLLGISLRLLRRMNNPFVIALDRIALLIPFWGTYLLHRELLRFSFSMDTLVSAGVKLDTALWETIAIIQNRAISHAVESIREEMIQGKNLSDAIAEQSVLPERLAQWVRIGESSGDISAVFQRLTVYYQNEVNKITSRFMQLIEPVMVIIIGILMILFIMSIILPIMNLFGDLI